MEDILNYKQYDDFNDIQLSNSSRVLFLNNQISEFELQIKYNNLFDNSCIPTDAND